MSKTLLSNSIVPSYNYIVDTSYISINQKSYGIKTPEALQALDCASSVVDNTISHLNLGDSCGTIRTWQERGISCQLTVDKPSLLLA